MGGGDVKLAAMMRALLSCPATALRFAIIVRAYF
jgi:Flp pilus assembly protein protease CpaA